MPRASSRKLAVAGASRIYSKQRQKLEKTISNRSIIAVTSLLSKKYGLLPCFCDHDPIRMMKRRQALILSKSSNAFWKRNRKSKGKFVDKEQQRNNSTAIENRKKNSSGSRKFQTIRKTIVRRFKRNNKKKMPTITARSVINNRTNVNVLEPRNNTVHLSNTIQTSPNRSSLTRFNSQQSLYDSSHLTSQDDSHDKKENDEDQILEPPLSSFRTEQQNINATNNTSRTNQETSQRQAVDMSLKNYPTGTRNISTRSIASSSKRKNSSKHKSSSKRKTSLSNKKMNSSSKRKNSKASLPVVNSTSNVKRMTYGQSPFTDPNMFHSMPRMQNSDEITKENVHENHLCCKPITSVKGLSTSDQKKLIEHDYLTLISLLPIYLGSQGNFQHKIREKTNISQDGAVELERLMDEWGSARLFIGANSHYKTLTQTI